MNGILKYPTHHCQAVLQRNKQSKRTSLANQNYFNVSVIDKYLTVVENKNQNYIIMIDDNFTLMI